MKSHSHSGYSNSFAAVEDGTYVSYTGIHRTIWIPVFPTAYRQMLWELMRLYDWRIITYISSKDVQFHVNS